MQLTSVYFLFAGLLITNLEFSSAVSCYDCHNCPNPWNPAEVTKSDNCQYCARMQVSINDKATSVTRKCMAVCLASDQTVAGTRTVTACCESDLCNHASSLGSTSAILATLSSSLLAVYAM